MSLAKLTSRIEFEVAIPTAMIEPIRDSTLIVVPVSGKHPDDSHQGAGNSHHDDEGIEPGLEKHHHQEIDQHDGEDEPQPQAAKGVVHDFVLTSEVDAHAGRQLSQFVIFFSIPGDRPQVAPLHVRIDIYYALNGVVVDVFDADRW